MAAVEFAEGVARRAGWTESDLARVALATSEAAANAVEHGGGPEEQHTFVVDCHHGPDGVLISVADGGRGPSVESLESAQLPDSVFATGGRGLHIMRQLADQVEVEEGTLLLRFRQSG